MGNSSRGECSVNIECKSCLAMVNYWAFAVYTVHAADMQHTNWAVYGFGCRFAFQWGASDVPCQLCCQWGKDWQVEKGHKKSVVLDSKRKRSCMYICDVNTSTEMNKSTTGQTWTDTGFFKNNSHQVKGYKNSSVPLTTLFQCCGWGFWYYVLTCVVKFP